MASLRVVRRLASWVGVDIFDAFGLALWMAGYSAFVSWLDLIVRAVRGESVEQDRKATYATAAFIGARVVYSATHTRETVGLHNSVVELRGLLSDAADDAHARDDRMRDLLRQVAADAEARDQRADEREERLYKLTRLMAVVTVGTLLTATVTLVITIVNT